MLVDPQFRLNDPVMGTVLGVIANRGPLIPEKIERGIYLSGHWGIDHLVPIRKRYLEDEYSEPPFDECGVCDNYKQILKKWDLDALEERVFVSLVEIRREHQSPTGGWRWHKWGEYIGDHDPQYEYLYDEKDIDRVFTFHIYEMQPEMAQ